MRAVPPSSSDARARMAIAQPIAYPRDSRPPAAAAAAEARRRCKLGAGAATSAPPGRAAMILHGRSPPATRRSRRPCRARRRLAALRATRPPGPARLRAASGRRGAPRHLRRLGRARLLAVLARPLAAASAVVDASTASSAIASGRARREPVTPRARRSRRGSRGSPRAARMAALRKRTSASQRLVASLQPDRRRVCAHPARARARDRGGDALRVVGLGRDRRDGRSRLGDARRRRDRRRRQAAASAAAAGACGGGQPASPATARASTWAAARRRRLRGARRARRVDAARGRYRGDGGGPSARACARDRADDPRRPQPPGRRFCGARAATRSSSRHKPRRPGRRRARACRRRRATAPSRRSPHPCIEALGAAPAADQSGRRASRCARPDKASARRRPRRCRGATETRVACRGRARAMQAEQRARRRAGRARAARARRAHGARARAIDSAGRTRQGRSTRRARLAPAIDKFAEPPATAARRRARSAQEQRAPERGERLRSPRARARSRRDDAEARAREVGHRLVDYLAARVRDETLLICLEYCERRSPTARPAPRPELAVQPTVATRGSACSSCTASRVARGSSAPPPPPNNVLLTLPPATREQNLLRNFLLGAGSPTGWLSPRRRRSTTLPRARQRICFGTGQLVSPALGARERARARADAAVAPLPAASARRSANNLWPRARRAAQAHLHADSTAGAVERASHPAELPARRRKSPSPSAAATRSRAPCAREPPARRRRPERRRALATQSWRARGRLTDMPNFRRPSLTDLQWGASCSSAAHASPEPVDR